jgi:hypothetical protein
MENSHPISQVTQERIAEVLKAVAAAGITDLIVPVRDGDLAGQFGARGMRSKSFPKPPSACVRSHEVAKIGILRSLIIRSMSCGRI